MLQIGSKTTQIDHVVVSNYGIFVIETKNYKGWILGKEKDEYWTQNIYGRKNKFKNPIRQNYGHIKALEKLLDSFKEIPIISIVAFCGGCELKVKVNEAKVGYFSDVYKIIKLYTNEVVGIGIVNEICELITKNNIDGKDTRKEHIAAIEVQVYDINQKISNNICPECGGNLVLRNGKYGEFKGCSNFPKCRYIFNK
jgi:hypothetical protein